MGLLDRILGRKKSAATVVVEALPCQHTVLVPRWDAPADIGIEDRAISYTCESCGDQFTPAETRELRESLAERLREAAERLREAAERLREATGES